MVRAGLVGTGRCTGDSFLAALPAAGLEVVVISRFEDAQQLASEHAIDLLMIGERCGDLDAPHACSAIRSSSLTGWIPLIVLLADANDASARIASLEAGADDAIPRDLGLRELEARTRAVIRRCVPSWECDEHFRDDRLEVDARTSRARSAITGSFVQLSSSELAILWLLLRESPALVPPARLAKAIGGDASETKNVRTVIRSLQRKLGRDILEVRRGWGYRYG